MYYMRIYTHIVKSIKVYITIPRIVLYAMSIIESVHDIDNTFLSRREITCNFTGLGGKLKKLEAADMVTKEFKLDGKIVIPINMKTHVGKPLMTGTFYIYDNEELAKQQVNPTIFSRLEKIKKKQKEEEEAAAAATTETESKQEDNTKGGDDKDKEGDKTKSKDVKDNDAGAEKETASTNNDKEGESKT